MTRSRIIAGRAVIILEAQDQLNKTLNQTKNKLNRFANEVGKIGEGLFRTGFFGSLATGAGVAAFVRFDDVIRELQVVLEKLSPSARKTDAGFVNLEQTILRLGRNTSFTSVQVAEAAVELGKAGLSATQVADSLQAVLDLARGTGIDTGRAVQIFVRAIAAYTSGGANFQVAINESDKIVSQFIKTVNKSVLDLEDLEAALRYTQGSASNLAISLSETLAILSELANQGLVGSIGGTSLNTALLNLVKKRTELLEQGGIEIAINTAGGVDIIRTLQNVFNALRQFNRVEQAQIIGDIFNIRGGRAIQATRELENIIVTLKDVRNASDEARRASDLREGGLGGAFRRLYATAEQLGIALTDLVQNILQPFVETVKALTEALGQLAKSNPVLAGSIFLSPGILLASGVALIALSKALRLVASALGIIQSVGTGALSLLSRGVGAQALALSKLGGSLRTGLTATRTVPQVRGLGIGSGVSDAIYAQRVRQGALARAAAENRLALALRRRLQYERILASNRIRQGFPAGNGVARVTAQLNSVRRNQRLATGTAAAARVARGSAIGQALTGGGRALLNIGRSVVGATKGFLLATRAVGRFIFSLNGILLLVEGLLLFTDLPERFGRGFSNAFRAIGRTAQFAQGPIELLRTAFQAFSEGRNQIGLTALKEGLLGIVQIVGNQLLAAWARFKEAIAPVVDFFHILWTLITQIVDSLLSVVKTIGTSIGTLASTASNATGLSSLFGGGEGFTETLLKVATAIAQFVPQLFVWIEELVAAFAKGGELVFASLARAFQTFNLGLDSETADRLYESAVTEINSRYGLATAQRNKALEANQAKIAAAFARSSEEINRRRAEQRASSSANIANNAFGRAGALRELLARLTRRDEIVAAQERARLQQSSGIPEPQPLQGALIQQAIKQTIPYAAALVTSASSVRGNILRFGKSVEEAQLQEQKTTNELLREQLKLDGGLAFDR